MSTDIFPFDPPRLPTDLRSLEVSHRFMTEPFGAWPGDVDVSDIAQLVILSRPGCTLVAKYQDKYVLKQIFDRRSHEIDTARIANEVGMMMLAGDHALPLLGRWMLKGKVAGFVTPLATSLQVSPGVRDLPAILGCTGTRDEIILRLPEFISGLHAKGVLHGDIKPDNLVLDTDSDRLYLIDFGEAMLTSELRCPVVYTVPYAHPILTRGDPHSESESPLSAQCDLYSVGITMWQLYTGKRPYDREDDEHLGEHLEDLIRLGVRPDAALIDDARIRRQVEEYLALDEGPGKLGYAIIYQGCVEVTCVCPRRHTTLEVIKCFHCCKDPPEDGSCSTAYRAQSGVLNVAEAACPMCTSHIV